MRQFAERGYLRFSFDYLRHYAAGLLRHRRSRQAYLDIPAEVEARQTRPIGGAQHHAEVISVIRRGT